MTNAIEHGPDGGEVTISATAAGGRGVMLIDRLATAWGVERYDGTGKAVWFRVAAE